MIEFKGNIFKMGLRACRKKKYSFDLEEKLKSSSIRISKDVIYLNDFYNLLYEKEEKETIENQNPPKYFKSEKFYTMRPGIDFPLIMNYTDTGYEEPYFYFLNGHGDVTYFADANFTPEQIESYEYTPWGLLLTSASKNNLLYTARELDFETGLQFNRRRYYNANLGIFIYKDLIFSSNYFKYVFNSPSNYIDPLGLYGDMFKGISDFWYPSPSDYFYYCNQSYHQCVSDCNKNFNPPECFEEYFKCRSKCFIIGDEFKAIGIGCLEDCKKEWDACIEVREKIESARLACIYDCISKHMGCMGALFFNKGFK